MRIDCFIMNPPYNSGYGGACRKKGVRGGNTKLCSNIMKSLEKHRVVCISNYAGTYSVLTKITQIQKQKFPGIVCYTFIWTMNGNINEYMSLKKMPYWSKTGNLRLYARWNYNFDIMDETKTNLSFGNVGKIKENFPKDFLLWLQTNETAQFFRKTFFHICTKTSCVNKLWEIYNENRCSNSKPTI